MNLPSGKENMVLSNKSKTAKISSSSSSSSASSLRATKAKYHKQNLKQKGRANPALSSSQAAKLVKAWIDNDRRYIPKGKYAMEGKPDLNELEMICRGESAVKVLLWLCENIRNKDDIRKNQGNEQAPKSKEAKTDSNQPAATKIQITKLENELAILGKTLLKHGNKQEQLNSQLDETISKLDKTAIISETISKLESKLLKIMNQIINLNKTSKQNNANDQIKAHLTKRNLAINELHKTMKTFENSYKSNKDMKNSNELIKHKLKSILGTEVAAAMQTKAQNQQLQQDIEDLLTSKKEMNSSISYETLKTIGLQSAHAKSIELVGETKLEMNEKLSKMASVQKTQDHDTQERNEQETKALLLQGKEIVAINESLKENLKAKLSNITKDSQERIIPNLDKAKTKIRKELFDRYDSPLKELGKKEEQQEDGDKEDQDLDDQRNENAENDREIFRFQTVPTEPLDQQKNLIMKQEQYEASKFSYDTTTIQSTFKTAGELICEIEGVQEKVETLIFQNPQIEKEIQETKEVLVDLLEKPGFHL